MPEIPPAVKDLKRLFGPLKILLSQEARTAYASDATRNRALPAAIVFPESVQDVVNIAKIASQYRIPITARGAGTGMSGGAVPSSDGILLSYERMDKLLLLNARDKYAVVEPGILTVKVQDEAAKVDLFYPPDPSSYKVSTIGGNIAENAGGLRCVKYGVTADYVLGLEFVTADGEIRLSGNFLPSLPQIDITQILCGSEGTLALITKVMLKLIPQPPAYLTLLFEFPSSISAVEAISGILHSGCIPCICEFIDRKTLEAITKFVHLEISPDTSSILLLEFDETAELNREYASKAIAICSQNSALRHKVAEGAEEREKLWKLRRYIAPSLARISSGKISEDIAIPRGNMALFLKYIDQLSLEINLPIPVYGHGGDGNLHINFVFNLNESNELERAHIGVEKAFEKVLDLNGTISGEHGIGLSKRDYLNMQFQPRLLSLHKQLKKIFDPQNLLNPGKIFHN